MQSGGQAGEEGVPKAEKTIAAWDRRLPRFAFEICPAVPAALWLTGGILLGLLPGFTAGTRLLFLLVLLPAGVLLWARGTATVRRAAWLAVLGLGLALFHQWAPWRTYERMLPRGSRGGEIRAIVVDAGYASDELFWLTPRGGWRARVTAFRPAGQPDVVPCGGVVQIQAAALPPAGYGAHIVCTGRFQRPAPERLPFEFDYASHLRSTGIEHLFLADRIAIEAPARGWRRAVAAAYDFRAILVERLVQGIGDRECAGMAAAMLFGYREGLTPTMQQAFKRSGTIHIIAISGLHIAIAATVFLAVMRLVGLSFRLRYWMLPVLTGSYVFLSGGAPSAVRAWIMVSIVSVCRASLRPSSPFNSLAVSALVLLFWNPFNLLNKGFQFSFLIVIFLVLGWRLMGDVMQALDETDHWRPAHCRPPGHWLLRRGTRETVQFLAAGGISWLGSVGLVAWTNGIVSPTGFPVNLAVCSLSWWALVLAPIKIVTGLVAPAVVDQPVAWLLGHCLSGIQAGAELAAAQGNCLVVGRPPAGLILGYYLLFVAVLLPPVPARWRVGLAVCWLAVLVPIVVGGRLDRRPAITVLSGAGSAPCVVIEPGQRLAPVALGGGNPLGARRLESWLIQHGYDNLQLLVLTDGEREAAGGAERLVTNLFVETLVLPPPPVAGAAPNAATSRQVSGARPHLRKAATAQQARGAKVQWLTRDPDGRTRLEHGNVEVTVDGAVTRLRLRQAASSLVVSLAQNPLAGTQLHASVDGRQTARFFPLRLRPGVAVWHPGDGAWQTVEADD